MYHMTIDPKIKYKDKQGKICSNDANAYYKSNKFCHRFKIDKNIIECYYSLSKYGFYGIKNLNICIKKDKKWKKIKNWQIENLPNKIHNIYVFIEPSDLKINIPNNTTEILIKGKFICPLKSKILKKIMLKGEKK